MHVYQTLSLDGQTLQSAVDLDPRGLTLRPKGSHTFENLQVTPGNEGTLTIAVTAVGVGPGNLPGQAQARQTINILSKVTPS